MTNCEEICSIRGLISVHGMGEFIGEVGFKTSVKSIISGFNSAVK
jgi:hypothetical protein